MASTILPLRWLWAAVVVGVLAGGLYSHPTMLNGELAYDDSSTITRNPVVLGLTPLAEVWRRDFWGQHALADSQSHKSFRPITTLTLRLGYQDAVARWGGQFEAVSTMGFHVVNVVLHAAVSMLCLPAAFLAFGGEAHDFAPALMTALLFAAHPVHSEAVENITGRAEELMALFFLAGFVVYASTLLRCRDHSNLRPTCSQSAALVAVLMCTVLSLLSKETGVTLPLLCSWWDFFVAQRLSLRHMFLFLRSPRADEAAAAQDEKCSPPSHEASPVRATWCFLSAAGVVDTEEMMARARPNDDAATGGTLSIDATTPKASLPADASQTQVRERLLVWLVRTTLLAVGTFVVASGRLYLNGVSDASHHKFRYNANRVALEPFDGTVPLHLTVGGDSGVHGINRALSIAWLWWRYFFHACVFPRVLNVDWSGSTIPLVTAPLQDPRVLLLAVWWAWSVALGIAAGCLRHTRPRIMAVFGFCLFPFILSANVLVAVGTTVAERCAYLPSLGVCMMLALVLSSDYSATQMGTPSSATLTHHRHQRRALWALRWATLLAMAAAYSVQCVRRNLAWSSNEALWAESFRVNPTSAHTCQNYAIHAAASGKAGALERAVAALDSVRQLPEVDRVDADEVYTNLALNLRHLGRWGEALEVLAEGWGRLDILEDALRRGVVVWHMHALDSRVANVPLRRARLLSVQAVALAHADLREACAAMTLALGLAPADSVVTSMAKDLEGYVRRGYDRSDPENEPGQV